MIIFTKDNLEMNSELIGMIDKEMGIISLSVDSQNVKKYILSDAIQKINDYERYTSFPLSTDIIFLRNEIKKSLALIDRNLYLLHDLENAFDDILALNFVDEKTATEFNANYFNANETVLNNTIEIERTLDHIVASSEFSELSSQTETSQKTYNTQSNTVSETTTTNMNANINIDEELLENFDYSTYPENTLTISDKNQLVYLPYTLLELTEIYKNNSHKYYDLEDTFNKRFTLPLKYFKNAPIARFREAFRLIRNKEHGSIKEACELGFELFFNYNLHPAIITASKNLDELDIYLDYLDDNEPSKFDCFKIVFDSAPVTVKMDPEFSYLETSTRSRREKMSKHKKSPRISKRSYN